jgi:tetratricopeptide (TPR) repeat protein|tara:strand:+ start:16525 stop:17895 length:1371 start_codon:yes stop_codon:yes gene_type:complete
MMANMTPEQMEQMRRMAGSMGMNMPAGATEAMRNMTADDMRRAAEEMGNMTPDQLKSQYEQAQGHAKATAAYKYAGSETLKKEGNALVGAGKHAEAVEKYAKVKENLADDSSAEANTLKLSCMLNTALCLNKIGKHNEAVDECTEALTLDSRSLKAYYRRGQAYVAKGELERGVNDLMRASKLSPSDETVAAELDACVKEMESKGLATPAACPEFDHPETARPASSSAGAVPSMPGMSPDVMAQMEQMMSDPNTMEQMTSMMGNLTDEQLEQMTAANPMMAGMKPEQLKQAAGMMKNMKPETMQTMMKMAKSMGVEGGDLQSGDVMAKMQEGLNNPEMREAMVDMIQGMDTDSLKEMSKSMGMDMDDAQAEQAVSALKNISPKTMERMLSMASMAGGVYSRFKRPIDWALRNKRTALSIFVVFTAVGTTYALRWWRRRGGDDGDVTNTTLGGETTF